MFESIQIRFRNSVIMILQPQLIVDLFKCFFGGEKPVSVYNIFLGLDIAKYTAKLRYVHRLNGL
jgi:hypothetical protein